MLEYILIIFMATSDTYGAGGVNVTPIHFYSKDSCNVAATTINSLHTNILSKAVAICVVDAPQTK